LNGLKTSSNSYGDETLNMATNRTQAPSVSWANEEEQTFTINDSWERELTFFCDAVLKDKPIETCGIDDAIRLMTMVDKVYAQ
jgi:hypothetical protein